MDASVNKDQLDNYVTHHVAQTLQQTEEQLVMAARSFSAVSMDIRRALILLGDNRDDDTEEQHEELRKLASTFHNYAEDFTERAADTVRVHGILFPDTDLPEQQRRRDDDHDESRPYL